MFLTFYVIYLVFLSFLSHSVVSERLTPTVCGLSQQKLCARTHMCETFCAPHTIANSSVSIFVYIFSEGVMSLN